MISKRVQILSRTQYRGFQFSLFASSAATQANVGSLGGYVLDPSDCSVPTTTVATEDVRHPQKRFVGTEDSQDITSLPICRLRNTGSRLSPPASHPTTQLVRVEVDQRPRCAVLRFLRLLKMVLK
jgi:hypothetical protein